MLYQSLLLAVVLIVSGSIGYCADKLTASPTIHGSSSGGYAIDEEGSLSRSSSYTSDDDLDDVHMSGYEADISASASADMSLDSSN